MSFWAGKSDSATSQPNSNESFEGFLEKDDDVKTRHTSVPKNVIIKNEAYVWLIQSLKNELQVTAAAGSGNGPRIKDVLFGQLRHGIISGRVQPSLHAIEMRFIWDPKALLNGVARKDHPTVASNATAIAKTATCYIACTVKDYMDAVWPSYGWQPTQMLDNLAGRCETGTRLVCRYLSMVCLMFPVELTISATFHDVAFMTAWIDRLTRTLNVSTCG